MSTHQGSSSSWSTRMYVDGMHCLWLPSNQCTCAPPFEYNIILHTTWQSHAVWLVQSSPLGCAPRVQHCINLMQLHHKTMCMWCRQASWVVKSVGFIMAKNGVSSVSCNLHRDQPELSWYANYLTTNDNILGKQLCSCSPFCNYSRTHRPFATRMTELY